MPSMPLWGRECNCKAGVSRVHGGSVCVRAPDRLPWLALCARTNQTTKQCRNAPVICGDRPTHIVDLSVLVTACSSQSAGYSKLY